MTHIDLVQAQKFVRQQANWPGKKLRRQLMGAALFLLIGGGYAAWHASAKPTPQAASPAMPVSVASLQAQKVEPFAEFSGRIDAVDYAEIRPQVTGRITEVRFKDGQDVKAGDVLFV